MPFGLLGAPVCFWTGEYNDKVHLIYGASLREWQVILSWLLLRQGHSR